MKRRWITLAVVAFTVGCNSESAGPRQMHKQRLLDTISQTLLGSVEAEKSAVLATTDEESRALALEAKKFAGEINKQRAELRQLIAADGRHEEIAKLDAFDVAWAQLERVDERLLGLAVENTNIKATQLLSREGATALDRFVDGLNQMQKVVTDPEMIRTLAGASIAALHSQSLLFMHIPAADDAEMTRLEKQMHDLSAAVEGSLSSVRERAQTEPEQLAGTSAAWAEYQRLAAEVIRFSRRNSNVISFDVSVHEKRQATKECLAALAALSAAIDVGPHSAR